MLLSGARRFFRFCGAPSRSRDKSFGNQNKGSVARVTNGMAFSYPGYNEMLTGYPDPKIDRNEFGPNPNVTVFEWLNRMPEFRGKVAVYGTWNVFQDIFNEKRSSLVMEQPDGACQRKGLCSPRARNSSTNSTAPPRHWMTKILTIHLSRYRCLTM